jgi:hypothetical protein
MDVEKSRSYGPTAYARAYCSSIPIVQVQEAWGSRVQGPQTPDTRVWTSSLTSHLTEATELQSCSFYR